MQPCQRSGDGSTWSRVKGRFGKHLLLLTTVAGVVFGAVMGITLTALNPSGDAVMLISYPGEIFMRLLKLMILPLIIASLITGCAKLNAKMNGKIAARTLIYFLATSLLNAVLGTSLALLIHPGNSRNLQDLRPEQEPVQTQTDHHRQPRILEGVLDLGRNIFPDNLFKAAFQQAYTVYVPRTVERVNDSAASDSLSTAALNQSAVELVRVLQYRDGTNTLGIIFFCLLFGTVLGSTGSKGKVVVDFFATIDVVVMRMVSGVMWLTPVGVSSVVCGKILSVDNLGVVLYQLGWFVFTVALGVAVYQLVIMQLIYFAFVRRNPFRYYWGLVPATVTAFATASTAATLPITFRCMDNKVHVDPRISRFVLPIGCSINMDGTALFVAIASIFIAQMNEISLGLGEVITVCFAATVASFSSASVPSAALVLIFVVLATIDVPVEDVTLLFAVDWFVDRIRTTNNMLGDCYAAAVVEHLSRDQLALLDLPADVAKTSESNGYLLPMTLDDVKDTTVRETALNEVTTGAKNGSTKKI